MSTRGRKPKPTALKLLEGNSGKRPLNIAELVSERCPTAKPFLRSKNTDNKPTGVPECPDWLEDEAKAEWERVGTILENMGMLTSVDTTAFAGYCQAYARWREAEEFHCF